MSVFYEEERSRDRDDLSEVVCVGRVQTFGDIFVLAIIQIERFMRSWCLSSVHVVWYLACQLHLQCD